MPLVIKCKECGTTFESKIQMSDTSLWHKPILTDNIAQNCPGCGKSFSYSKEDHFFQ